MDEDASDVFVGKEPCPECGSRNNLGRWADGHAHCFGHGCDYWEPADPEYSGEDPQSNSNKRRRASMSDDLNQSGDYKSIRNIDADVCKKFGYKVGGTYSGQKCHIASYRNAEGDITAQHIRLKGKDFPWIGKKKGTLLFGQHAMRDGASKVIITEGEVDAMSVWQIISGSKNRWAAVSIKSGADGAKKDIAEQLQWLDTAGEVILMFDMDEPGQEAARECAKLFKPGRCKIASLPLKDANDMLREGRGGEVVDAIFGAKEYRPEGIVTIGDVRSKVLQIPTMGMPWFVEGLNDDSYGRQYGELVGLGAGTGVGKTDFLTQQITYDITELHLKTAIFFLEQQPHESVQRMAGKLKGQTFHIPPDKCKEPWSVDQLEEAMDELDANDNLRMYDHFGVADYDKIEEAIRYLYHSQGIRIFYLDHLTALAAQADSEKDELERIMSMLGGIVKELPIWVCYVSHLTTPDGKPHEEGGRVMIRHFKGSRSIGFWSHRMYGLERDQQAEDEEERKTTTLRCIKDRPVGSANGKTYKLGYDENTGRLYEKDDLDDPGFPDEGEGAAYF